MRPDVRALLVCPRCKGELVDRVDGDGVLVGLLCARDGVVYPVVDGVPWLTVERARKA